MRACWFPFHNLCLARPPTRDGDMTDDEVLVPAPRMRRIAVLQPKEFIFCALVCSFFFFFKIRQAKFHFAKAQPYIWYIAFPLTRFTPAKPGIREGGESERAAAEEMAKQRRDGATSAEKKWRKTGRRGRRTDEGEDWMTALDRNRMRKKLSTGRST